MTFGLLTVMGVAALALAAGYLAGFRMGQVDRQLRTFIAECRRKRLRSQMQEVQQQARAEAGCPAQPPDHGRGVR